MVTNPRRSPKPSPRSERVRHRHRANRDDFEDLQARAGGFEFAAADRT